MKEGYKIVLILRESSNRLVVNKLSNRISFPFFFVIFSFRSSYIYMRVTRESLLAIAGVAQNLPKLENEISLVSMSVQYHSTLEKYKDLHSRAHIYIAHGPSKGPGPRYRPKIKVSQSTPCWYSKLVSQEA